MKKILISLAIAILIMSCSSSLKEGEVYDKQFHQEHTTVLLMPIVHKIGKTTYTTMIPMTFYYPDAWSISYKVFDEEKNKWKTRTVWVSKQVYDATTIGSWYIQADTALAERPRIRKDD